MRPGQILVADHAGVYVIKMTGDVRLTLCISFDQFIDAMLSAENFSSVLFDLSEAEAVDSTTLGLMAKISLLAQERRSTKPVILATNASIQRILQTMGFADIFIIVDKLNMELSPDKKLTVIECDENMVKEKVIEAHKILMGLNAENHETFKNLVNMLENS
ncbi:MAG TPA: STAS domain-containing protein [Cellvibrio sp.]|nr:STAS domain-containing protein [Cellvibrio sp.]